MYFYKTYCDCDTEALKQLEICIVPDFEADEAKTKRFR